LFYLLKIIYLYFLLQKKNWINLKSPFAVKEKDKIHF